jgi:phosphatidylcholine synthase
VPPLVVSQLLTGFSALCALLAMVSILDQSWEAQFVWLGLGLGAQVIASHARPDETGQLAVSMQAMGASGFALTTFVPVAGLLHAGFLDGQGGLFVAGLIILSALYRYAYHAGEPTRAGLYTGLPVSWAIVAFLLHAFDATPPAAVLVVGLCVVLSLIPIPWPDPVADGPAASLTRVVVAAWALTAAHTLIQGFPGSQGPKTILVAGLAYGLMLTAWRSRQSATSRGPSASD